MQRGRNASLPSHGKNAYGVINVNHLRATYFSMLETHPRQLASHQEPALPTLPRAWLCKLACARLPVLEPLPKLKPPARVEGR